MPDKHEVTSSSLVSPTKFFDIVSEQEEEKTIWSSETRVHGGCLGAARRRRTRLAAKSPGEEPISHDPGVSEWGNPTVWMTATCT